MMPLVTSKPYKLPRTEGALHSAMGTVNGNAREYHAPETTTARWLGGGVLVLVVVLLVVFWRVLGLTAAGAQASVDAPWLWLLAAWGAVTTGAFAWRVMLWRRYRPHQLTRDIEQWPRISVVIPAFNESREVACAIESVARADYPRGRLQIIAVDDGSTDDTWLHMRRAVEAARAADERLDIQALQLQQNGGKREALYAGMQLATGSILVTVDSDTRIEANALREIVVPFINDHDVGCVAGSVRVANTNASIITRFLRCYFSLSFRYVRAYQDAFRGVFCAPGALSAYRMSVIRPHLDAWRQQTFLGQRCITGEDRALTNIVLRAGALTAYQDTAVAWSAMPTTYMGLALMFLRWARSNVRETLALWSFLMSDLGRRQGLAALRFNMLLVAASLLMPYVFIAHAALVVLTTPLALPVYLAAVVGGGLVSAAIYYANERDHGWVWLPVYQVYWLMALSWVFPLALLTPHRMGWLTRGSGHPCDRHADERADVSLASA